MENLNGRVFLGRFRVDDLISTDGGIFRYRGFDIKRSLALSIRAFDHIIPPDPSVLCFQQNSLTLQTIMHPNIIPFYGLYEDAGRSFVIEKYYDGPSLAQLLLSRGGKPMPPNDALIYLKSVAIALEYVHGFGLVHSTLSPIIIQVTRDGSVMLGNFGFSRSLDKPMTETGVFGLPFYLAPEQLRAERVFPSTDIYALGALFFELLTGIHPFLGVSSSAAGQVPEAARRLREGHLTQEPPDPLKIISSLPAGLSQTLQTALAKAPRERYQSAQEMLEISCAVLGTTPRQVPDRIGGGTPAPPTQIVESPAPSPAAGRTYPGAAAPGGTEVIMPPQAGYPAQPGRQAPGGTQVVSGASMPLRSGTQAVPGGAWQAAQPGFAPPAPPRTGGYELPKRRRPAWLLPAIGGIIVLILVCIGIGMWAGLPYLREMLATTTPTATLTEPPTEAPTETMPPTSEPPAPASPLPPAETAAVLPTEAPPVVTEAPPFPPSEVPSPTAVKTAFKVTVRNNLQREIYAFRDGTLMGSNPIPPGMYIWYLNIPAGPHTFRFCLDMTQGECPEERQVVVDEDVTITVR